MTVPTTTSFVNPLPVYAHGEGWQGRPLVSTSIGGDSLNSLGSQGGEVADPMIEAIWLTHILSQADHRLNHVEPWAEKRLHTLRGCIDQPLHPLDVSDDRLARVLQALSDDARWSTFENALTQQLVRVYALRPERVRLDSTTASGSWAVTPEGPTRGNVR
jgi:hypothetical protein